MGNVIEVDFSNDNSGYMLTDGRVEGVYNGILAAIKDEDVIHIGTKEEGIISHVTTISMDEMNEFCLMWLLIFNPEVIIE